MRVVVLGGTGTFGARIVRALLDDPLIELLVASRHPALNTDTSLVKGVALDMGASNFAECLRNLSPGLVIHCVGPFQGQDYRVGAAALQAGAHYLDLADGREFTMGFARELDEKALRASRVAITGASTLPALSSAVVDHLREGLSNVESVEIVIAPGQRAPRGLATLEAVFSYLGQPFKVWRNGRWTRAWGWMDLHQVQLDVGIRLSAACDVPDLGLLPERYPGLRTVTFHAALEFGSQHLALWTLAALRRIGLPFPVTRWAVALSSLANLFETCGGENGGMSVCVTGLADGGTRTRRTWQLVVPAQDGPEIPCLPAILLARKIARGQIHKPGAVACVGLLKLSEFAAEFARWNIATRTEEAAA